VIRAELRLRPQAPLRGRRVAVFTTGAPAPDDLDAEVVLASTALADRARLREDLARADGAEVFVVELKAAAIDVVAEAARERGVEVVLAANDVDAPRLDEEILKLVPHAVRA
jgi:cyclic 2,3-diphosphoglycerate synthetase